MILNRFDEKRWINSGRTGGIHIRYYGARPHCSRKKPEKWECRLINIVRGYPVVIADKRKLGFKVAMLVPDHDA